MLSATTALWSLRRRSAGHDCSCLMEFLLKGKARSEETVELDACLYLAVPAASDGETAMCTASTRR